MVSRTDERTSLEEPGLSCERRGEPRELRTQPRKYQTLHTKPFATLAWRRPHRGFLMGILGRAQASVIPILRITAVERTSWRTEMSKVEEDREHLLGKCPAWSQEWREDVPVSQGIYQGGSRGYHRFPEADWPASDQCIAGGATLQHQQQQVGLHRSIFSGYKANEYSKNPNYRHAD